MGKATVELRDVTVALRDCAPETHRACPTWTLDVGDRPLRLALLLVEKDGCWCVAEYRTGWRFCFATPSGRWERSGTRRPALAKAQAYVKAYAEALGAERIWTVIDKHPTLNKESTHDARTHQRE